MLFDDDQRDDFDDEPEDVANFHEFSDDSPESEPEMMGDNADKSVESAIYNRIVGLLRKEEVEEAPSPLAMLPPEGTLFQPYEEKNHAYTNAFTAYYEDKNYQEAIEKFDEAIENASQRAAHDLTEEQSNQIVVKSMYWQAEAYVKMQNIPQAVETFKALAEKYYGHYLALAAQRRADELNAKNS